MLAGRPTNIGDYDIGALLSKTARNCFAETFMSSRTGNDRNFSL